jgi:hypothetical protein
MFRTPAIAALLALSLTTAAQAADTASLNSRIHEAAENVCAPLLGPRTASLLYRKWYADCVTTSAAKITAAVVASQGTSTALLAK